MMELATTLTQMMTMMVGVMLKSKHVNARNGTLGRFLVTIMVTIMHTLVVLYGYQTTEKCNSKQ